MKAFIIFGLFSITFSVQLLYFSKKCACPDMRLQQSCLTNFCYWEWESKACRDIFCADHTSEVYCKQEINCKWENSACKDAIVYCSKFSNEFSCDGLEKKYNCAWNGYRCSTFTKCSDYVPGKTECYEKSSSTQECQENAEGKACEDYVPTTCASFRDKSSCKYSSTGSCIWDSYCKDVTTCANIRSEEACNIYSNYCKYEQTCKVRMCTDNITADSCEYSRGLGESIGILCKWNTITFKCTDADDTSALTETTCSRNTKYTFTWDGTKCIECTGSSGFNIIRTTFNSSFNSSVVLGIMFSLLINII